MSKSRMELGQFIKGDDEPTPEQLEARRQYPPTRVRVEPVSISVAGGVSGGNLHVRCGDFEFRIQNHPYAAKLGALDNERLKIFLHCEAHRIANFLERMKREVKP